MTHPATRRCGDVVTTSLSTSQRRRRYVSIEKLNDVSMKRQQDVSVICLHNILLERLKQVSNETPNEVSVVHQQDVLVVRIHDFLLVRLYDVSCKSQMKHPIMSLWCVSTMPRSYVVATFCLQVSTKFSSFFVMISIWQVSHLNTKSNIKCF